MIKKKNILLLLLFFSVPIVNHSQNKDVRHKFGISTGMVVRAQPIKQISTFSTNEHWYASNFPSWVVGNAALGFSVDLSYEAMFKNLFLIRLNTGIESTGYFKWVTDIGGGVRTYLSDNVGLSFEGYLSIVQTGASLGLIVDNSNGVVAPSQKLYMGLFGFKGRIALEVAVGKKMFFTPYISYAAYPWLEYTLGEHIQTDLFFNGIKDGLRLDSFQIGFEIAFVL